MLVGRILPIARQTFLQVKTGHWLIDSPLSTLMSRWEQYRKSRTSWGINVLGSFCVEIEASDGTKGFATGFGGPPACWLVQQHFERFLIGAGECAFGYTSPRPQS
jgi:L-rhamnonate dehydratase